LLFALSVDLMMQRDGGGGEKGREEGEEGRGKERERQENTPKLKG
jgi:hypothetical protein